MTTDRVTVVVMTRDRWPDLRRSLAHHEAPVILVDNGSADGTPGLVRRHFPRVDVVALEENVGSPARNVGVARADTAYVAFADDDSWWAPGALATAARVLDAHERLGLLAGRILVGADEREDPTCRLMRSSPLPTDPSLPGPAVLGFLACGAVVRREAYLAAGGFDPVVGFLGEEDRLALDLATLGWQLAYVDDVVAHHHPSPGRRRDARHDRGRRVRAGRNRLLTAVMRRPWRVVGHLLSDELRAGPVGWRAVAATTPRLAGALRARRPVPPAVEARRRLIA